MAFRSTKSSLITWVYICIYLPLRLLPTMRPSPEKEGQATRRTALSTPWLVGLSTGSYGRPGQRLSPSTYLALQHQRTVHSSPTASVTQVLHREKKRHHPLLLRPSLPRSPRPLVTYHREELLPVVVVGGIAHPLGDL